MAHQVVWEKMALQNEDGTDTILRRGQLLPAEGVSDFQLGVLTSVGAVRFMDDMPSDDEQRAMAAELPEDPDPSTPPAGLPPAYPPNQTGDPGASTDPERPANSATKPEWVEYAVSRGMDRTSAERLSKDALINRYPSK
jgi:hypothetical protein